MPINWNSLQPQPAPKSNIIPLPSAPSGGSSDGGIGDLFSGLSGLVGGMTGKTAQTPNNTSYSGTGSNILGNLIGRPQSPGLAGALHNQTTLGNYKSFPVTSDLMKTPAFQTAYQAHNEALKSGTTNSPIMTVVDYSKPAQQPRMWVVDTNKNQVLLNTYVAQGSTPGFSNQPGSHQSSLGTFKTSEVYNGSHGESMRVQGLEPGVNDNALQRAIVVHGGNYVGPDKSGTSWGCFTVPNEVAPKLIGLTQNGTIIHAYAPNQGSLDAFKQNLPKVGQARLNNALKVQQNFQNPNTPIIQNGLNRPVTNPGVLPNYMPNSKFDPNKLQQLSSNNPSLDHSTALLKQFEGLENQKGNMSSARWDVNAYRVGYGSDTYTTADGKVHKVTANTIISREDAERDLQRRIPEFQTRAKQQIGSQWDSLTPEAQAGLTSVTYNYGSLPASVVNAAKTGDVNRIAEAVRGLKANKSRRQREADFIKGTYSLQEAPGSGRPSLNPSDKAQPLIPAQPYAPGLPPLRTANNVRFEGGDPTPGLQDNYTSPQQRIMPQDQNIYNMPQVTGQEPQFSGWPNPTESGRLTENTPRINWDLLKQIFNNSRQS